MWYAVFYSPFDVVCRLSKFFPIKLALCVVKEVQRTYKISHGVTYAAKIYPESYLVQLLVGVAKGAGSGVVKIVEKVSFFSIYLLTQKDHLSKIWFGSTVHFQ